MRPLLLKKGADHKGDLSVRNDRKSDLGAPFIYGMSVSPKKVVPSSSYHSLF